jgi:hypothetical protein
MKNGVAMVVLKKARVFQQVGTTSVWNEEPVELPLAYNIQGEDIEVHSQHIMISSISGRNNTLMLRKVDGTWRATASFVGNYNSGGDTFPVPYIDLDVTAGRAAIFNEQDYLTLDPPFADIYSRVGTTTSWTHQTRITGNQDTFFGPEIAVNGDYIAITGSRQRGTSLFYADPSSSGATYALSPYGLQAVDGYLQPWYVSGTTLERAGEMFFQRNWSPDRNAYVINGFNFVRDPDNLDEEGNEGPDPARSFTQFFQFQAKNGGMLGDHMDTYGGRTIVSGRQATSGDNIIRVFDTTGGVAQWPVRVFDFESATSESEWRPSAGSAFTRAKVGYTWVYRQTNPDGTLYSVLPPPSIAGRMNNQSIQSEVTLRGFTGPNAWIGLVTRYHDPSNYYYVTLRAGGSVEVKRMVNGVFTTLAAAPANVVIGRKYRLRLESIGTTHRVHLDDTLVLTARDDSLSDGYVGIVMNRAAADYDNVTTSPSPFTTIYTEDFSSYDASDWKRPSGTWTATGGVLRQTNGSGYGIAATGSLTDDQVVRARITPRSFNSSGAWVGLVARYLDERNHLYINLYGRGVVSLWRRTNGVIEQLATQRLTVTPGTTYDVRVEVVAGTMRVFVNDQQILASNAEAGPDNPQVDWSKGQVGLITRNATADFDDFVAYQP